MLSNEQQLLQAWLAFLGGYVWHHAITLTTRVPYSAAGLSAAFEDRFVRDLGLVAQRRVAWFYALEYHTSGHPHLHALVAGTSRLTAAQVQRPWRSGLSRVDVLDPTDHEAAVRYIVKSLGRFPDHFNVSRRWIAKGNTWRSAPETLLELVSPAR